MAGAGASAALFDDDDEDEWVRDGVKSDVTPSPRKEVVSPTGVCSFVVPLCFSSLAFALRLPNRLLWRVLESSLHVFSRAPPDEGVVVRIR